MSKKIPYARQLINRQDVKAVTDAFRNDFLTQGPLVAQFEEKVAEYCGAKYAVAVNSGTAALHLACLAAGLRPGDEGITTPITFVASANCLLYCGAKPIFADIDEQTVCLDAEEVMKHISKRTKVIIPVHFGGQPCEMKRIYRLAKKRKITVIEDACHALGASYRGSRIGSCRYSDMTVLSFHAVKHITTGEGGMVLTNSKDHYEKLKMYRNHGIIRDPALLTEHSGGWYYEMQALGFNYRLTDFQCALGISQLKQLDRFVSQRRRIVRLYDKAFAACRQVRPIAEEKNRRSSYHLYILRFDLSQMRATKKELFDEYRRRGIMVNLHYIPVYQQPYYRGLGYKQGICPVAEAYYREALTLPLYPGMKKREIEKVISVTRAVIKMFGKKAGE